MLEYFNEGSNRRLIGMDRARVERMGGSKCRLLL